MRTPDPSSMDVARLVTVGEPLEVGTAPKPAPGPHEVIVRVEACGLVPNTFNVVNGRTPFILPRLPAVFGLDAAGTIEALGERVLNLRVGQRVYVDPHLTCGTCEGCRREEGCELSCLRGCFAQTERAAQLLDQQAIGALAQYVPAAATAVVPLPESIDLPTAARFGYLGTSFAGLATAGLGPGRSLLVNGVTGTLGVAAVAIALDEVNDALAFVGGRPGGFTNVVVEPHRRAV